MNNFEWSKPSRLGRSNLNVWLIKVLLDYGHLKLKTFCILFVGMGMFCDFCQKGSNVEFGCKLILDQRNGRWSLPNKCAKV
jgi:hypothetical protein